MIRKVIRSILLCRADEPIVDCIERRCVNIKKRIDNRTVRNEALKSALDNIGICSGDNIMVHCSWRNLYQLRSTPEEIIRSSRYIIPSTRSESTRLNSVT